jgi:hypothetical protein
MKEPIYEEVETGILRKFMYAVSAKVSPGSFEWLEEGVRSGMISRVLYGQ